MNTKKSAVYFSLAFLLGSGATQAQELTVTVENLTNGINFTPLLVAAHTSDTSVFRTGTEASTSLQAMAEGGDLVDLVADLTTADATLVQDPAAGMLAPGQSTTTEEISTDETDNRYLSVVAMMLPTNDGFVGLDSWMIPRKAGTYKMDIYAYDAGTEANNELINSEGGEPGVLGIPADPGDNSGIDGTGVTTVETNTKIHVHRGILGDSDLTGGLSDLNRAVHRWQNPVARVTVEVQDEDEHKSGGHRGHHGHRGHRGHRFGR